MSVEWFGPTSWVDYRGFNIYLVDGSNNLIDLTGTTTTNPVKNCACSGANCPDQITSCTVTGLDAFRTYTFHVRAYDSIGNTTSYLSPSSSKSAKRTLDTTSPTFSSNVVTAYSGGVSLGWSAATDNQYATEAGATMGYQVWRKASSTFGTPTNPALDGSSAGSTTGLTYMDSVGNLTSGLTYYYTICAMDASTNKTCDGNVASRAVPDVVSPVISSVSDTKTVTNKTWDVTWALSDNITPTPAIAVDVWQKVSATSTDFPATTGSVYLTGSGITAVTGETNITGTSNQEIYVNYLIRATDQVGLWSTATRSVFVDNLPPNAPSATLNVKGSPVANGATTAMLTGIFTGTCDSTNLNGNTMVTSVSVGSYASIRGFTCSSGTLAATLAFKSVTANTQVAVTFNTTDSRSNNAVQAVTYTQSFICPTNYLGVPWDAAAPGVTADFCVAKYEMKAVTTGGALVAWTSSPYTFSGNTIPSGVSAASRPDSEPWRGMDVTVAANACAALGH
jgi:hypothetical protein